MKLLFTQAKTVVARRFDVPDGELPRLAAQLQYLQKINFPFGERRGRGHKLRFGYGELFKLVYAVQLMRMGQAPGRAAEIVEHAWPYLERTLEPAPPADPGPRWIMVAAGGNDGLPSPVKLVDDDGLAAGLTEAPAGGWLILDTAGVAEDVLREAAEVLGVDRGTVTAGLGRYLDEEREARRATRGGGDER